MYRKGVWAVGVAVALLLGACGAGAGESGGAMIFSGAVPNSKLFLGISSDGTSALAYASDGDTMGEWFEGTVEGNQVVLSSDLASRLTATLSSEGAEGSLTVGGDSWDFTIPVARRNAGLYRTEQDGRVTGWIVLADGRQKGVTDAGGKVVRAPELRVFTSAGRLPARGS